MTSLAIVNLNKATAAMAARLARVLGPAATVHGFRHSTPQASLSFEDFGAHVRGLVRSGTPTVALCAVPVLTRVLAPLLAGDSTAEQAHGAVVALSPDGAFAVPVLGAHRARPTANALARDVADAIGGQAVISTATDTLLGLALDAPPTGWTLANPGDYKPFAARLAETRAVRLAPVDAQPSGSQSPAPASAGPRSPEGTPGALVGEAPRREVTRSAPAAVPDWLADADIRIDPQAALTLNLGIERSSGSATELVLHPARVAVGVGCERGADPAELLALVQQTLSDAGVATEAVGVVVSLDLKADEPAVHAVAAHFGVSARFFDAATLEAERARLATPSDVVFREVGCHGVSEGAALAAAGDAGVLRVPKRRSARATCALAVSPTVIDAAATGTPRGVLTVVGHGPGSAQMFTPEAGDAIRAATHLVGYSLYLDIAERLVGGRGAHQQRHDYGLGEERERVRAALALAATGARVALVCSGDPGVYALATLAVEVVEASEVAAEQRVALEILPGVSAAQAAAARAGAPLGHDFCFISLSDLLTPFDAIVRRVQAAADGDFVIAFYNPVSQRRRAPFERAVEILAAARPASTPVIIARSLGRAEEQVRVIPLAELHADLIDMLTTVVVGSSQTRVHTMGSGRELVYTPRGYDLSPGDH